MLFTVLSKPLRLDSTSCAVLFGDTSWPRHTFSIFLCLQQTRLLLLAHGLAVPSSGLLPLCSWVGLRARSEGQGSGSDRAPIVQSAFPDPEDEARCAPTPSLAAGTLTCCRPWLSAGLVFFGWRWCGSSAGALRLVLGGMEETGVAWVPSLCGVLWEGVRPPLPSPAPQ